MRGIVALLWNPGPLVLELRRKTLPRHWMKAITLPLRQSVHIQPRQGSGTTSSPHLQRLKLITLGESVPDHRDRPGPAGSDHAPHRARPWSSHLVR